jgi:hypothetical protein
MVIVKRKVGLKDRPHRKRSKIPSRAQSIEGRNTLQDIIEDERTRLMKVRSILGCVVLAMEGSDGHACELDFPDILELTRSLINESINHLDSVNLRPFLSRPTAKR